MQNEKLQYRIEWSKNGKRVDAGSYPTSMVESMIAYLRGNGFDYTVTCNGTVYRSVK